MQRCSHSFSTASALRSIFFPTSSQTCVSTFLAPSYATDFGPATPTYQHQTRSQSSYSRGGGSYTSSRPPMSRVSSYSNQQRRERAPLPPGQTDPALRKFGAQEDRRPKDEEIDSYYIILVEKGKEKGNDNRRVVLRDLLRQIDREKEFVVQVGLEGGSDAAAQQSSRSYSRDDSSSEENEGFDAAPQMQRTPVCKIMSRKEYFLGEQTKTKKGGGGAKKGKELELSWSVDKNDLKHRMNQVERFLADGKKVEIFLAPKRRGKPVTLEEAQSLVKEIKDRLLQGTSFKESKEMEGKVGETLTLFFEKKG